jgi:hypothetical protein
MRTGTKLNDGRPYRNMFFAPVTYNNDLAPFQGASAGWAVPRVSTLGDMQVPEIAIALSDPAKPRASGSDSRGSVMSVPAAAVSMTPAPSMTPAVPAPAAIIPAVVSMPPKRPIVASVAVIARIVAVAVAGTTVIAAVPWIVAAAKRENYLRLSRTLGCKEQAACCDQNKKRFHAWNLMPASESRI